MHGPRFAQVKSHRCLSFFNSFSTIGGGKQGSPCRNIYSNLPMKKLSSREQRKRVYSHKYSSKRLRQVSEKILDNILGKRLKNLFKVQRQNSFLFGFGFPGVHSFSKQRIYKSDLIQSYLETFKSPSVPKMEGSVLVLVEKWSSYWNLLNKYCLLTAQNTADWVPTWPFTSVFMSAGPGLSHISDIWITYKAFVLLCLSQMSCINATSLILT